MLKTMGGGGVSVCVADEIEQSRKELFDALVAGLEQSEQGPWRRKNVGGRR